jgi:hypothetical protein
MFGLRRFGRSHAVLRHIASRRTITSGRSALLKVHEEVQEAIKTGKPVVALETTIYTHGKP